MNRQKKGIGWSKVVTKGWIWLQVGCIVDSALRQFQVLSTALKNGLQPVDDLGEGGPVVRLQVPAVEHDVVAGRDLEA